MGLGPAVCENCHLIAEYHPNKEDPTRQGDHLCPSCRFECNNHLFAYPKDQWDLIFMHTSIVKENRG